MKHVDHSWNAFKLRVNINAGLETVYRAWATTEGLESWFLRRAIMKDAGNTIRPADTLLQKGDRYQWYWFGYPDSITETGEILAANGKDQFRFSFAMNCPVNISLYKECGETIVELTESEIPEDEEAILNRYLSDSKGWLFYLANLKSVLEGGLDLRNRKVELANVITC